MEDAVLVGHLRGDWDSCRSHDPHSHIPGLHLYPCGQLVLLLEGLLQLALHLRPGVIVIQSGQERSQLPRVMLDGVKMVLVLVVAGVVGGSALDLFVQFLFQLLVVLFCAPDVPVLSRVHGLPGHLCAAGKEDAAGGKTRHDHEDEQKKNAHDHQNVCVALGGIHQPLYGSADGGFTFFYGLFHAGPGSRCTVGCRLAACGLRRRARPGGGIVALPDVLFLPPPGKPVGAALAGAGCTCILCRSWLRCGRFSGFGAFFALHLGFLLELPGIAAFGNITDISCRFFALAQRLHTDVFILVLVNFVMHRRPSGMGGVHLSLLRLAQPAQFVRGQFCLAEPQMLGFFCGLFCIGFQLFLFGHRLLHLGFLRGRTGLFCGRFLFDVQLRFTHFCAPSETSPNLVVIIR